MDTLIMLVNGIYVIVGGIIGLIFIGVIGNIIYSHK